MSKTEGLPVALIQSIYEAVGDGDLNAVLDMLHPEFVLEQSSALPFAGTWRGADGFKALGAAIFQAWPDFAVQPVAFASIGEVVLVITRITGTNSKGSQPLDQQMIEYWRVVGGKAVECRPYYFDPVAAARSAGSIINIEK